MFDAKLFSILTVAGLRPHSFVYSVSIDLNKLSVSIDLNKLFGFSLTFFHCFVMFLYSAVLSKGVRSSYDG